MIFQKSTRCFEFSNWFITMKGRSFKNHHKYQIYPTNSVQFYLGNTLFLFYSPRFRIISSHRISPLRDTRFPPLFHIHCARNIFTMHETIFKRIPSVFGNIEIVSRILYIPIVKRPRKRYPTSSNVPNDFSIRVRSFRTGISMRDRNGRKETLSSFRVFKGCTMTR